MNYSYTDLWDISNQCEREIIRISHDYQMQHNISDTEFWILYTLHENEEEMTQTDIGNCLYAPRQSTNSALKRMEQDGTVEKIPIPGNKKSKYIGLTSKGRILAEQVITPMKEAEKDTFAAFSQEEIEVYLKIMQKRCDVFRTLITQK